MIKTYDQALLVQTRRYSEGKRGYSKAVRRFMRRQYPKPEDYEAEMKMLPKRWRKPREKRSRRRNQI